MSDEPVPTAQVRGIMPPFTGPAPGELPATVTIVPTYPLYSADQVGIATFFSGPLGGAWLIARNYKRLGNIGSAWAAVVCGVLATVALFAIVMLVPHMPRIVIPVVSLVGLISFARAAQGDAVEHHTSAGGPRGSSWIAAGTGLVCLVLEVGVAVGIVVGAAYLERAESVDLGGGHEVFYKHGGTEPEARAVGLALQALGYWRSQPATVFVERHGDKHVVAFVVADGEWLKTASTNEVAGFAEPISKQAFSGQAVDIELLDVYQETKAALVWELRPVAGAIDVDRGKVTYRDGGTEAEARAVSVVLRDYFGAAGATVVVVQRDGDRHVVAFLVNDRVFTNTKLQAAFWVYAEPLSKDAFGGKPVDLWLNDANRVTHVKSTWETRPIVGAIDVAQGQVKYRDGGTEAEAHAVAAVLHKFFEDAGAATVVVSRDGDRPVVAFVLNDGALADTSIHPHWHGYAKALSDGAFDGKPVNIWLNDTEGGTHVKMTWETRPKH